MALTASSHPAVRTFRSWASRQRTWNARTRSSFQTCSARGRRGAGRADYSGRRGVYHIFSLSFLCWPHTWPHTRMHTPAYTNTLTHAHLTYAHTHPPRSPVILRPRRQGWHKHAPHRRKEEKEHTCDARTPAHARAGRHARPRMNAPSCLRLSASFLLTFRGQAQTFFCSLTSDRNGGRLKTGSPRIPAVFVGTELWQEIMFP